MQYTAKGNKIIWHFVIPLIVLAYLVFRITEWHLQDRQRELIAKAHVKNIQKHNHIDGLILGGSNATFSLSAKEFSNNLNSKWYNLALLNEGYSYENYWGYIKKTISINRRKNIKSVIYSPITPLRNGRIESYKKAPYGIEGDNRFKLVGSLSIAEHIKNFIMNKPSINYPLPDFYGDFDFKSYNQCNSEFSVKIDVETDKELLIDWVIKQLESIRNLFPNATIYFTRPSEFYGNFFDENQYSSIEKTLKRAINKYKINNNDINSNLILEKPYPNKRFCCDAMHHGNESGRSFRTKALIEIIEQLPK